jgi:protein-disulfide isomerase
VSSRAEQKAAAKAARLEREAEQQRADTRRRRLAILGGLAAVAAIVVVAVLVLSGGSDSGAPAEGEAFATSPVALEGIPQEGVTLGRPDAPVRVVEFADLQCPFCKRAAAGPVADLIRGPVAQGRARIEFRDLAFLGDDSVKAAQAAAAAGTVNRLWQFVETFYANQGQEDTGYVTDAFLRGVAKAAGVDPKVLDTAATSPEVARTLQEARTMGNRFDVTSTPTFVVFRPGQEPQTVDGDALVAAVGGSGT